jgi:hypothetical protein
MQLVTTPQLPANLATKAEFTLKKLGPRDGTKVVRSREYWYNQFKDGKLTLDGLRDNAPLVAEAVQKHQIAGRPLP